MAPEIALSLCECLAENSLVLDPMCGSGTVVRTASEKGHRAVGFDLDPLAILMTAVYTTPLDPNELHNSAEEVRAQAETLDPDDILLPWIDQDNETREYVEYWFAQPQRTDLRRLSSVLRGREGPVADALRLVLSRLIVTKERGASLARDASHSRPHRVRLENDFPVLPEFIRSAARLTKRLHNQPPPGNVLVRAGDARRLSCVPADSVDAVITSPPYLNALDYIRGHRLSLVWLGHRVADLRTVRGSSIGTERYADPNADIALAEKLTADLVAACQLPSRERGMLHRYTLDMLATAQELYRVLVPNGKVVLVVGNSCLRGVFVENALLVTAAAQNAGFSVMSREERELPPNRRYLPPPSSCKVSTLEKRMRTESVLTFIKPLTA
jgi:DNA modification methylase